MASVSAIPYATYESDPNVILNWKNKILKLCSNDRNFYIWKYYKSFSVYILDSDVHSQPLQQ